MILDGKALAADIKAEISKRVWQLSVKPTLAVIVVGSNPASRIYVNGKMKDCKECGINSREIQLLESASQQAIIDTITMLNSDVGVDGILVQLPLPKHIDERAVLNSILPNKDVDGLCDVSIGKLITGKACYTPCTPYGIITLLMKYNIPIDGKHCVIIGRSNIVGKPLAMLMLRHNATVTVCHTHTTELNSICQQADILVAAAGKPGLITADMVKPGAVVIDVAMNRRNGKLCGDVDFEAVKDIASYITPVPGGIGPMTRAMLLMNLLEDYS